MGVILYLLLGGYRPFRGTTDDETMEATRYGEYRFHDRFWSEISQDAKDLIRRMLVVIPHKRLSAAEALETEWIKTADNDSVQKPLKLAHQELQLLVAKRKVRGAVHMVRVHEHANSILCGR